MPVIAAESQVGRVTLLELCGRLTGETIGPLHQKLQELAESGPTAVLLDCSQVSSIDSPGLGILVRDWVTIERRGGKLKLLRLSPRMEEALTITGLVKLFECFDEVSAALGSF